MLAEFGGFLEKIIASTWNMLNSSSPWIIFSFLVAGLLHEFLKPEKIQKTCHWFWKDQWRILDNYIRNVYSNLQLWNDSTWNQYVLQWSLSWTDAGIYDQYTDD